MLPLQATSKKTSIPFDAAVTTNLVVTFSCFACLLRESTLVHSMTGHGQASVEQDQFRVAVEVRTVNNRFLKTSINTDLNTEIESRVEQGLKAAIRRGSVSVRIKAENLQSNHRSRLNSAVIQSYWTQLSEIAGGSQSINVESLLTLPGVVEDVDQTDQEEIWPVVETALEEALKRLMEMRATEGEAMQVDMLANIDAIQTELTGVEKLAPTVSDAYSKRLTDRINKLLEKFDVTVTASDVIKEVGIFADRSDVSEENRSALDPPRTIPLGDPAADSGQKTRLPRPGNAPRNQHHRLQSQQLRNCQTRR